MSMMEFIEKDRDEWRVATMKLRARNDKLTRALRKAKYALVLYPECEPVLKIVRDALEENREKDTTTTIDEQTDSNTDDRISELLQINNKFEQQARDARSERDAANRKLDMIMKLIEAATMPYVMKDY